MMAVSMLPNLFDFENFKVLAFSFDVRHLIAFTVLFARHKGVVTRVICSDIA